MQVLLKLVLSYSDILIKIYKFLEPNLSDDDDNKADLNECIFILISLIKDVYNSSTLNVVDKDDDEKKISFDSIECHILIVKCMSISIYLISLTGEDDDNEMFVLKYIHLITNKSFEIRNEVIKSIELIIKNNNNDYFNEIKDKYYYENLTKLIKFYNSNRSETDTDSDDLKNRKIIRKDYLGSLRSGDNALNLRSTVFMSLFSLIKISTV